MMMRPKHSLPHEEMQHPMKYSNLIESDKVNKPKPVSDPDDIYMRFV